MNHLPQELPDALERAYEQQRRVRLFNRIAMRRDLISFRRVADICAKEPGSLRRHEDLRMQAFHDLGDAVIRGDFGTHVYCMPACVPTYRPFWIRRTPEQVAGMRAHGHDETPDLWAPRAVCARWLRAQAIHVPEWLEPAQGRQQQAAPKSPFNEREAHGILAGMKVSGSLAARPSREEAQAILERHFRSVSREQAEKLVKKIWGEGKRGPRNRRNRAQNTEARSASSTTKPRISPRK